jgi:hypothetical protein
VQLLLAHVPESDIEFTRPSSCTRAETQIPPGSAKDSSRAAMMTPSPKMSPSSTTMHADAPFDAPIGRKSRIQLGHARLHLDRAAQGIDDAGKLDQEPVPGGLDDAAMMLVDLGINQLGPNRLEARERVFLVGADQT